MHTFDKSNFHSLCDQLVKKDKDFNKVFHEYGYPPFWSRPGDFSTLVRIILEQQVSLASAKAAFDRLREKIGVITPAKVLALADAELKACYFSRQKTRYAKCLAEALQRREISLKKLAGCSEEEIRKTLKQVKGIGDWTVDVYLLFALKRADVFPVGDLAMVNALKEIKGLPPAASREAIIGIAESWRPHRSIATMFCWHHYIQRKGIKAVD